MHKSGGHDDRGRRREEGGCNASEKHPFSLFSSSPWKLDLGRVGEVKELGVIEK